MTASRSSAGWGVLAAAMMSGCSWAGADSDAVAHLDALPQSPTPTLEDQDDPATSTTISASQRTCVEQGLDLKSLAPSGPLAAGAELPGTFMAEIVERGRLRVGVDENTLGFAYRNPRTGHIEGFEVELAHELAKHLFGQDYDEDVVEVVPVVTETKISAPRDGVVDLTISANSMGCRRWEDVSFSAEYYTAHQQFLVHEDSGIDTRGDLVGATVCVTEGSSSARILSSDVPDATLLLEPDRTGCLLALQEGTADAYFGHDSFLHGMLLQDETVTIVDLLPPEDTVSHYGIAIAHEHPEFVRWVNAALETIIADGTWPRLHQRWLQEELGMDPETPPRPQYRDRP